MQIANVHISEHDMLDRAGPDHYDMQPRPNSSAG
jgi:hypothetical protein